MRGRADAAEEEHEGRPGLTPQGQRQEQPQVFEYFSHRSPLPLDHRLRINGGR